MVEIRVAVPFTFQSPDGTKKYFVPGLYSVDAAVAQDWYVKAHLEGYEPPPAGPGTLEWAEEQRLAMLARDTDTNVGPVDIGTGMATRTTIAPAQLAPSTEMAKPVTKAEIKPPTSKK